MRTGSGSHGPTYASRRILAEPRRSKHSRVTTRTRKPSRSRTSAADTSRRNESWTTSSASNGRPQHPVRDREQPASMQLEVLDRHLGPHHGRRRADLLRRPGLRVTYHLQHATKSGSRAGTPGLGRRSRMTAVRSEAGPDGQPRRERCLWAEALDAASSGWLEGISWRGQWPGSDRAAGPFRRVCPV